MKPSLDKKFNQHKNEFIRGLKKSIQIEIKELNIKMSSHNKRIQQMENHISNMKTKYWPSTIIMWQKKNKHKNVNFLTDNSKKIIFKLQEY